MRDKKLFSVGNLLDDNETIITQLKSGKTWWYATTQRIIKYKKTFFTEKIHQLPYKHITSIQIEKSINIEALVSGIFFLAFGSLLFVFLIWFWHESQVFKEDVRRVEEEVGKGDLFKLSVLKKMYKLQEERRKLKGKIWLLCITGAVCLIFGIILLIESLYFRKIFFQFMGVGIKETEWRIQETGVKVEEFLNQISRMLS